MTVDAKSRNRFAGILLLAPVIAAGVLLSRHLQQGAASRKASEPLPADARRPSFAIASAPPADSPFALTSQTTSDIMGQRLLTFTVDVRPRGIPSLTAALAELGKSQATYKPGERVDDAARVARYFRMTIRPLDGGGKPTAPASSLALSPLMFGGPAMTQQKLAGQIPVSYSPHTRRIALDLACLRDPAVHGHWILQDFPRTQTRIDTQSPPITHAGAPGISVEGIAAIVPDIDPNSDPKLTRPHRDASGMTTYYQYPFDYHLATGLPAIQLALRVSSPKQAQYRSFAIGIDDVQSDWQPVDRSVPVTRGNAPQRMFMHVPPKTETFQMYCGPAYAPSLKRLRVSGRISEHAARFETLTLPAADAIYDPALHRYDIRWKSPASATAPSSARIIALNPWRRQPHARHIPPAAQPPRAVEPYAFVTIAWEPPANPPGAFAIPQMSPILENPLAPKDPPKPAITQASPVMRPAVPAPSATYVPPVQQYINGNTYGMEGGMPSVTDYCLPGSNAVGGPGEHLSPSVRDLNKSEYKIIRFAIPITIAGDDKSYPPIHFGALRFDANGEAEVRRTSFVLNLPFSKQIPRSWMPEPNLVEVFDTPTHGGFPEAAVLGGRHPTHLGERSTLFNSRVAPDEKIHMRQHGTVQRPPLASGPPAAGLPGVPASSAEPSGSAAGAPQSPSAGASPQISGAAASP